MPRRSRQRSRRTLAPHVWFRPVLVVGGAALVLFLGGYLLDYYVAARRPVLHPLSLLLTYDAETAENALGNLAQVVVAVLGIVITVVSIVVQLAANRYTPRITDMFFRDRTNIAVLSFFVTTCISSIWVSLSVGQMFIPHRSITITLVLVTISLLLMIPYFAYVFDFLDPEKIVGRIQEQAVASALHDQGAVAARQQAVLLSIEQLCDVAQNAVSNKDKLIASGAVNALKDLARSYIVMKSSNPPAWFTLSEALQGNPDFVAMAPESLEDLTRNRTWLEWKVMRQMQAIYNEALQELPDINYLIAIDTRYLGEAALLAQDHEALRLSIKFMNTFMRVTLNTQKVRTAYNVLNQYRQLAEKILQYDRAEVLCDIANYMRYYAQVAQNLHLGFVTETVAYDMAALCEAAFAAGSAAHDPLLTCLLSLDQQAETEAQEVTLRGVRKAQIKLATGYLVRGQKEPAHKIYLDMKDERPERLRSIRDELLRIESKDFWEIIDRGTNFDYLDDARKEQLKVFFTWFPSL